MSLVALSILLASAVGAPQQRPQEGSLLVGEPAVDFKLRLLNSKETFKLSDNFGKRPTILIFGSYT
jgi:hypothetical protein